MNEQNTYGKKRCAQVRKARKDNCAVTWMSYRGVTREGKGAQFPGGRITAGAPRSPKNVTSTFFNKIHLFPKDLKFEVRTVARKSSLEGLYVRVGGFTFVPGGLI